MRKWFLFALTLLLLIFFFFNFYQILRKRVVTSEFKLQTEKKLSQIFKANVKVGKIRFGLLKQVSLSGLQIGKLNSNVPLSMDVQRITIKYNLADFLGQNFKVPTEVSIDAPAVKVESMVSPFDLFGVLAAKGGSGSSLLKKVELNQGQFQVRIPYLNEPLLIQNIKGKFWLEGNGVVHVNLKGEIGGLASGLIEVRGELTPEQKAGRLECSLANVTLNNSSVPIKGLNGKVTISDSDINFENLKLMVRNLPVECSGKVQNAFRGSPKWQFQLQLPHIRRQSFTLNASGEAETESINGNVSALGHDLSFDGTLYLLEKGLALKRIRFDNGYEATGEFNYKTGMYTLRASKGVERVGFEVNLKDFKANFRFDINHWSLGGHDFTTNADIGLEPIDSRWELGDYRFKSRFKTNYLILDYHPLRDFKAEFEVSELGVNPMTAEWGNASKLVGSMSFGTQPSVDFNMEIANVELHELQALGLHPLPPSIGGQLEGKIRIIGSARNPDASGRLIVRDGKISDFKYDEGIIEFYGTMPHLKLLDSKIIKKDNTFLIQGDVDFELKNILQKVKIVSLDQVIIWKGLDVESEVEGRKIQPPVSNAGADVFKPLNASTNAGKQKLEAEYDLGGNRSIKVTAEDEKGGKQEVTVGPKIRF